MRILVTGGRGLVGQGIAAIAKEYPEYEFIYVSSRDADLRSLQETRALLRKHAPLDGIIHLAANVGGLYKNMEFPVQMFEDNLLININILKAAHLANIERVLCFLSTCIFPDRPPGGAYPITHDMLHSGPPHDSNEGYAYAKRMQEVQCRAYQKQYGRQYFCVVPTNIYGPHDNFDLTNGHVLPALIHKCFLAKQMNTPFKISGDGTALRQFIYSHDVAQLIVWAFGNYHDHDKPLILAPPSSEVSIETVVQYIAEAFDFKGDIVYDTSKPSGQHKKTADVSHLSSLSHGITFTPLKEGIATVAQWFSQNYNAESIRK